LDSFLRKMPFLDGNGHLCITDCPFWETSHSRVGTCLKQTPQSVKVDSWSFSKMLDGQVMYPSKQHQNFQLRIEVSVNSPVTVIYSFRCLYYISLDKALKCFDSDRHNFFTFVFVSA